MKWIRLWTDEIYHGTTFQELDVTERGIWFSLLVMAGLGEKKESGVVELRIGVPYSVGTLAELINCDPGIFQACLEKMVKIDKIEMLADGRIKICNWEKYQTRYERYYKEVPNIQHTENVADRCRVEGEGEGDKEEEVKKTVSTPLPPSSPIPESLAGIKTEIENWLAYKLERRQGYKPRGLAALWRCLLAIPEEQRAAAIQQSMANNWAGIFPPKENYGKIKHGYTRPDNSDRPAGQQTAATGKYDRYEQPGVHTPKTA